MPRLTLCCLLLLSLPLYAAPLPLAELLANQVEDPAVRAAEAEGQALGAERELRQAQGGWQVFAGVSAGHYRELVTEDLRDEYDGRDLTLGLRHPLLGSLKRQADAVQASQHEQQRQQLRVALRRAEQRLALRSAYADWWRAQQEAAWCAPMAAATETAVERIEQRLKSGWLLASEAHLQRSRWQELGRRCAELVRFTEETQVSLAQFAGVAVPDAAQAVAEPLADRPQAQAEWLALLERHPRLAERQDQLSQAEQARQSPWYGAVESDFSLAQSVEDRGGAASPGNGLVASLNFSAPLDLLGYDQARRRAGEARYQAAEQQLLAERRNLGLELGRALRAHSAALSTLALRREQLAAAELALRERRARAPLEREDGVLRELDAEREYYLNGFALIAAWHATWLREAALRLFGDDDAAFAALLGQSRQTFAAPGEPRTSRSEARWSQASYVWDSRALLDPVRQAGELQRLHRAGMQGIYVGLDAAQVRNLSSTRPALQQLLTAARRQGLSVGLLLGDPAWIQPAGRAGLLTLIASLRDLPFASLHLDLEVEQLGWPVPDTRLQDWLDTLQAAAAASPWPLALSSHPRWFVAAAAGQTCVPCALPGIGVQRVSLMIYTRNTTRSSELTREIAQRWPALQFRLAQSLEPELPASESWAGSPLGVLRQQLERWREALQPLGVTGIDWQAWKDFPH